MDEKYSFVYDPQKSAFDTGIWKELTAAVTSGATGLVFNNAEAVFIKDMVGGEYTFKVTIPAVPTAADERIFGVFSPAMEKGIYFEVDDNVFKAVAKDGSESEEQVIAFTASWATASVTFNIKWDSGTAVFSINGTKVATLSFIDSELDLATTPLSPYVLNTNADNLLVKYLMVRGVRNLS